MTDTCVHEKERSDEAIYLAEGQSLANRSVNRSSFPNLRFFNRGLRRSRG